MRTQLAYCSASDRDVHIVITDGPSQDGHANLHDTDVVCLEIGDDCTGNLCPIGATAPAVMAARLVRNGLQAVAQPLAPVACGRCDRITTHILIEHAFATCSECGATSRGEFVPDM